MEEQPNSTDRPQRQSCRGFTLIEMSIALVIIALLVGGIVVGREMIVQAQIRAQFTQVEKFKTAHTNFKIKYNCIPGDCRRAASFGLGANGNGDDRIRFYPVDYDSYRYFGHLSSAGLIDGHYTGQPDSSGSYNRLMAGENVPHSIYHKGVGVEYGCRACSGSYTTNFLPQRHFYAIGSYHSSEGRYIGPLFSCRELTAIDTKYDDGNITTGTIVSRDMAGWGASSFATCTLTDPSPAVSLSILWDP